MMIRNCSLLGIALLAGSVLSTVFPRNSLAQSHYFTVRDSIEMSRFLDRQDPKVEFSPDGNYFATVTSRGIIHSNSIESTLWVFSTAAQGYRRFARSSALTPSSGKKVSITRIFLPEGAHATSPVFHEPRLCGASINDVDIPVRGSIIAHETGAFPTGLPGFNRG